MKSEGHRCPNSGVGLPHGKDKKLERRKRAQERAKESEATKATRGKR